MEHRYKKIYLKCAVLDWDPVIVEAILTQKTHSTKPIFWYIFMIYIFWIYDSALLQKWPFEILCLLFIKWINWSVTKSM